MFVDEDLVEAAGFSATEDCDEEIGVGIAWGVGRWCQEGYAKLGELDGVGDGGALLFGDGRGSGGDGVNFGTAGNRTEVFCEERLELGGVEVSGYGHGGVVGSVELLEEVADVVETGGFDVGVGPDDVCVIGMVLGEEELVDLFAGEVVGCAFALASLVADDVALVGELFAVEAFEEEAHAVAFEPEGELELVAGNGFEVVGAVEVGGAVDVGCAGALDVFDVGLFADVLGAFEHHVFEEMGEAGAAGALVERADVIPEVDGDEGKTVVFVHEDDEAVWQDELLVLQLRHFQGFGWRERVCCAGAGYEGDAEEQRGGCAFGQEM